MYLEQDFSQWEPDLGSVLGCRGGVGDAGGSLHPPVATEAGDIDVDGGRGGDRLGDRGDDVCAVSLNRLLHVSHVTRRLLHRLSQKHM